ncbi:ASKHA domain-containing protein [Clostridia bacterium OttesenSCG-928-F22]|nr:ASKHA domain-containing protein [Clostridia bacterium OttesenSCG-928-F22]
MAINIIITSDTGTKTVCTPTPASLAQVLVQNGFVFSMPCAKQGICGKCKVLASGALSPLSKKEKALLSRDDVALGMRLACQTEVLGDASITLPQQEWGDVSTPSFSTPLTGKGFGIAFDIGTTTLHGALYSFEEGRVLKTSMCKNPQGMLGADVITRLHQSLLGQRKQLQLLLLNELSRMAEELCDACNVALAGVSILSIVGNTAMLYLLHGCDATPLTQAPFIADHSFGKNILAGELGLSSINPSIPVYIAPVISAFVGADILAGTLSLGLKRKKKPCLLLDIGTNGEMVLKHGASLTCCSVAAGPALEGATITNGMQAVTGAIYLVEHYQGKLAYRTIHNAPAKGICASGLIDAISEMRRMGVLDEMGQIQSHGHAYTHLIEYYDEEPAFRLGSSGVYINQQDIHHFLSAKAAIAAGVETLLAHSGITPQDINRLYLAGGFGSYLNAKNAAAIGLLPSALVNKTEIAGNTALQGALLMLDMKNAAKARRLADEMQPLSLSEDVQFQQAFIRAMKF